MPCSVCQHPAHQAIDQALLAGSPTFAALAKEYNLSTSALHRHKTHLQAKLTHANHQLQDNLRQGCIFWLSQALAMTMQVAQTAQAEGNPDLVLKALAQGARFSAIILKQNLNFDHRLIFNLLNSPQWAAQTGLLPDDPGLLALGRQSLTTTLGSPCPETAPAPQNSDSPEDLALMQQFLHILGSAPDLSTSTENREPQTANHLAQWDKGGKLPEFEPCEVDEEEQYRMFELDKKLSQIDLEAMIQGLSPAAAVDREEEILQQLWDSIPIPTDKPLSEYLREQSLEVNSVIEPVRDQG